MSKKLAEIKERWAKATPDDILTLDNMDWVLRYLERSIFDVPELKKRLELAQTALTDIQDLLEQIDKQDKAVKSIAQNSCCASCQEAGKVALLALQEDKT